MPLWRYGLPEPSFRLGGYVEGVGRLSKVDAIDRALGLNVRGLLEEGRASGRGSGWIEGSDKSLGWVVPVHQDCFCT